MRSLGELEGLLSGKMRAMVVLMLDLDVRFCLMNERSREPADEKWQTWYETFDENHRPQERQEWYSDSTTAYRWARPRYPEAMLDGALRQAGLDESSTLLEIGCGPGIATSAIAKKELSIIGVEPSSAACNLARKSCQDYKRVSIVNSTFEDYPLPSKPFDAVLAATSFHWIAPEVACKKSATALKPGGSLVLLWATPPQPSEELSQFIQPIYDRYDLSELGEQQCRTQAYYQANFELFADTVSESGFFQASDVTIEQHHSVYSIEKYLSLLSTLSPYIALAAHRRDELMMALGDALAERLETGAFDATHWFAAQVSPRLDNSASE